MPPLPVEQGRRPQEIWFKLFRPEFLSRYPGTLSSDAFSNFGRLDAAIHNGNVGEAARQLLEETIPLVAAEIIASQPEHFTKFMQERGVNARFLGRVRHACSDEKTKRLLLHEMIARCAAGKLRDEWRADGSLSYEEIATALINEMRDPFKEPVWLRDALQEKYGSPFCPSPEHELEYFRAVGRMLELCGVVVKQKVLQSRDAVTTSDLKLEPRLKVLTKSLMARADQFWAMANAKGVSTEKRHALVQKAKRLLETNLISDPNNVETVLRLGRIALLHMKEASSEDQFTSSQSEILRIFTTLPLQGSIDHLWMKAKSKLVIIERAALQQRDAQVAARQWREAMQLCGELAAVDTSKSGVLFSKTAGEMTSTLRHKLCHLFAPLIWDCILFPEDYNVASACMADFVHDTPFVEMLSKLAPQHDDWRTPKYFWLAVVMCRSERPELLSTLQDWMGRQSQLEPHWLTHCAIDDAVVREIVAIGGGAGGIRASWSIYQSIVTNATLDVIATTLTTSFTLDGCGWITADALASFWSKVPSLTKLTLRECPNIREWPAKSFPSSLTELSISLCPRMTAPDSSALFLLPQGLAVFKVTECASFEMSQSFMDEMRVTSLVHFEGDNLSAECAALLPKGLRVLRLKSRMCGSEFQLPELRVASIGTHVTMEGLRALGTRSPLVEELDLSNCSELLDAGQALVHFARLRVLVLDGNIHMTSDEVVKPLLQSGARLSSCSLTGVWALSGMDLLRVLDLEALQQLSVDLPPPTGFLEVLAVCPHLKKLTLCKSPSFSELSWTALCEHVAPRLETLVIRHSTWLTDERMHPLLAGACAMLQELELQALPFVNGSCLCVGGWPRLRKVTLISCCGATQSLARAFCVAPRLAVLDCRYSGVANQVFHVLAAACPLLRHLSFASKEASDPDEKISRMPLWSLAVIFPFELMAAVAPKLRFAQLHSVLGLLGSLLSLSRLPSLSSILTAAPFPMNQNDICELLQGPQPIQWLYLCAEPSVTVETFQRCSRALAWLEVRRAAWMKPEVLEGFFHRKIMGDNDSWGWVKLLELLGQSPNLAASVAALVESFRLLVRPKSAGTRYAYMAFWGDGFSCRLLECLLQSGHHVICAVVDLCLDSVGRFLVDALRAASIDGLWFVKRDLEHPQAFKECLGKRVPRLDTVICIQPGFVNNRNLGLYSGALLDNDCRERIAWFMDQVVSPSALLMVALRDLISKSPDPRIAFPAHTSGSIAEATTNLVPFLRLACASLSMLRKLWALELPHAVVVGIHFGAGMPGLQTVLLPGLPFSFDDAAQNVQVMLWAATKEHGGQAIAFPAIPIPY